MAKTSSVYSEASPIDVSLPTIVDLSSAGYVAVKRNASTGNIELCGANDKALGILQNAPNGSSSKPATAIVRIQGISKAKINEGVTFGKYLTPVATTAYLEVCDAADEEMCAMALCDGDANDIITVLVMHGKCSASDA